MSCIRSGPDEAPRQPVSSITGSARRSETHWRALLSQLPPKIVRAELTLDYSPAASGPTVA
jgi:hypothetical protein